MKSVPQRQFITEMTSFDVKFQQNMRKRGRESCKQFFNSASVMCYMHSNGCIDDMQGAVNGESFMMCKMGNCMRCQNTMWNEITKSACFHSVM